MVMPNEIAFALYDSFAAKRFSGNVAGVIVLQSPMNEDIMQAIAAELGAPTTGFASFVDPGAIGLRFFTPDQEIEACGHVSLAVAIELAARGVWDVGDGFRDVQIATAAGPLPMRLVRGEAGMRGRICYTPLIVGEADSSRDLIEATLGVRPDEGLPVQVVATGLRHLVVGFTSVEDLAALRVDDSTVRQLANQSMVDTICAFAQGPTDSLRMRDLTAAIGVVEEPASGTTSSALAKYAYEHGLLEDRTVSIVQGVEMGRPSLIEADIESGDGGRRAWVGGAAIKTVMGTVLLE